MQHVCDSSFNSHTIDDATKSSTPVFRLLTVIGEQVAVACFTKLNGDFDELVGATALVCYQDRIGFWHEDWPIDLERLLDQAAEDDYIDLALIV